MSDAAWPGIDEAARQAAVRICWAQWMGLGSFATVADARRPGSVIDVEALILMSLHVQEDERRLAEMVAWWAEVGAGLTSLQRMRAVAKRFPGDSGQMGLRLFATLASHAGERRWSKEAEEEVPGWIRLGKGPEEPTLIEACALWPRLRAGFGVGAKADILTFLIGLRGTWASAAVISFATGYSSMAVGKAVGEMAMARLIQATRDRPVEYVAPARAWAELLELYPPGRQDASAAEPPPWRFWSELFAFLAGAMELAGRAEQGGRVHVLASAARDLVDRHDRAFNFNGISTPPMEAYRGLDAVRGLEQTVWTATEWMEGAV